LANILLPIGQGIYVFINSLIDMVLAHISMIPLSQSCYNKSTLMGVVKC
jgi:hypothetical protein